MKRKLLPMRREQSFLGKTARCFFRALARILRWGAVAFVVACIFMVAGGLHENVFKADVIVIPGNAVSPEGEPSARLAARLDRGLELYTQGMAERVIVSGGTGWQGVDEATAMKAYLVGKGIPAEHIITDSQGVNTWATARFTASWLRESNLKSALVVTQYFHVPRTCMAFERFGVTTVGKAYARFWEWRDIYSMAREVPGWLYYRFRAKEPVNGASL